MKVNRRHPTDGDRSNQRYGLQYLVFHSNGRSSLLRTATIDWIEGKSNYVNIHRGKQSLLVRKSLKELERELDPDQFIRIHRSAIVNMDRVRELQKMFHGEIKVILEGGTVLTLSLSYREQFRRLVGGTL